MNEDVYANFIKGLELKSITLKKLNADLRYPEFTEMGIDSELNSHCEVMDDGRLHADVSLLLKFKNIRNRRIHAKIEITLSLEYTFVVKPDEESLGIFRESSLLINAWPYFRFWVQTITQNFGWPPLTLPLFKTIPEMDQE